MIIKLSSEKCQPCKILHQQLEEQGLLQHVLSLDVYSDKGSRLAAEYGIRAVPALIINGAVLTGKECTVEAIRNALQDSGL